MRKSLSILGFLLASLMAPPAFAQPSAEPPAGPVRSFSAVYALRMFGVVGGELTYELKLTPQTYEARATQRTIGLVRSFVQERQDYRSEARGRVIAGGVLAPEAYQHQGGRKNRLVRVRFGEPVAVEITPPLGNMGDPPATQAQMRGAADALTSFMQLVATPTENGPCGRTLRIFDGKSRFDLEFRAAGRSKTTSDAFKGEAIRCTIHLTKIAGFEKPEKGEREVFTRPLNVWFTQMPNGMYAMVRLEAPVNTSFGRQNAVIYARSLKVSGPPLGQQQAARR